MMRLVPAAKKFFSFPKCPYQLWGQTQLPVQQVLGTPFLWVKWLKYEAHHCVCCRGQRLMELSGHTTVCFHGMYKDSFIFVKCVMKILLEITNRCICMQWILCQASSGTSSRDNLRQPMIVPVAVDTVELRTPEDGRVCRPKHVEWTKQRNKIHCIQLHLLVISNRILWCTEQ